MAKGIKPPPTPEEQSAALADLKARIAARLGKVTGNIPGSAEWAAELQREIDNAIDGSFVARLKTELHASFLLVQGGKGPVVHDDVEVA